MPAISKIRFTNIIYENGDKRYNDELFQFDGHNAAILLENGGGKTVFVQTAIQAVLPHAEVAERKIQNTLMLENNTAHIAIEWIINENPRRYALTAVTLFMSKGKVDSNRYVYEYGDGDDNSIEKLPFVIESNGGKNRPATKEEISEYYYNMSQNRMNAHTFSTIKAYHEHLEKNFKVISSEWRKIALINGAEGGVEAFFDGCKTTGQLVDQLLIPVVEEALAGKGTTDFADTFEKQREHFKKHKQLRERIEESKLVEGQINKYVAVFEDYYCTSRKFIEIKEKAKAIYNFTEKEKETNDEKISENNTIEVDIDYNERYWKQKKASYDLEILNGDVVASENNHKDAKEKYFKIKDEYEDKQKRYENIQIAKYKLDINEQNQHIEYIQKQIDTLDEEEDIEDIRDKLIVNTHEIKGYYEEQEHNLKRDMNIVQSQIDSVSAEIELYKEELSNKRLEETNIASRISSEDTTILLMDNDMNKICRETLSNPVQESIEEECEKWQNRVNELNKIIYNYDETLKKLQYEKMSIEAEMPNSREKLNGLRHDETIISEKIRGIDEKQFYLLLRLNEINKDFEHIDSLYLKEDSIIKKLELRTEILKDKKEGLLLKERLAHRFLDDYKECEYYTGEPQLEKWIEKLENQYKFIELGTKYIQRVVKTTGKKEQEFYEFYPYWAESIIVSDSQVEKLIERIRKYSEDIIQPILIITESEARSLTIGENIFNISNERSVFPALWEKNLSQDYFKKWKTHIEATALEVTKERKANEVDHANYISLQKDIKDFFNNTSYSDYQEYQKKQKSLKDCIRELTASIDAKEKKTKFIEEEYKRYSQINNEAQREEQSVSTKIQRAQDYFSKKNSKLKAKTEKTKLENECEKIRNEISRLHWKIKNTTRILEDDYRDKYNEVSSAIKLLKSEELYNEVKSATSKATSTSFTVLKEERKDLKDILAEKQKDRSVLEDKLRNSTDNKKKIEIDLNNFIKTIEYDIDEQFVFPMDGDDEIVRLLQGISNLKGPLKKLKDLRDKCEKEYDKRENTYTLRKDDFCKEYDEIIKFSEGLEEVEKNLKAEHEELEKKKQYMLKTKEHLNLENENIKDTLSGLKAKNEKYAFLSEQINCIDLQEDIVISFPYKRKEITEVVISDLAKIFVDVEEEKKKVQGQKSSFINFCESYINDIKLKEMVVSGVNYKENYEDIMKWQQKISERIAKTIEIAENDMREHDKEVQQFISHLHSYLYTMAQELKLIPKKTRIKVEDAWKEIFIISVPEWDEKEGKEELSKHIDWMLKQLEDTKYKDENGIEIDAEVKKVIEKWLQSKQLLQIVMKQNNIKVKCRKVTNDGNVNSQPYTWEVSNSWSGGEKWSKNMTLFLGILNYLSEKRQLVIPYSKRHRTVIVDNPFGKASSDHVLDPVFFIAEQLGFQILALTAHSEGKFIRTYFPIVYSCKLKVASNSNAQIITKEREIRTAFLKDNDPQTLLRLGQYKQLELFDYLSK